MFCLFILFVFTAFGYSEEIKYLFINSYPIKAKIIVNGVESQFKTPCLLKDIVPKSKIQVLREGYNPYLLTEGDLTSKKVFVNLVPSSFDLYFPEKTNYQIGSTDLKGPVYVSKLKSGTYDINVAKDKISFSKLNYFLPFESALGTSFTISLGGMIASIAMSEYFAKYANEAKMKSDYLNYEYYSRSTGNADIAKIATISATSVLALALVGVIIADVVTYYYAKSRKMEIADKSPSTQDILFYDSATQFMSIGEIDKSTQILKTIISLFPDTELIPKVYYQLGQNYFILGDFDNSLAFWEIFINDYPIAEYYDYVIKNIADIYYAKKDLKTARLKLENVIFSDNIVNKEMIYSFKAKLDYEIYASEKKEEFYKASEAEYQTLINLFPNSQKLDLYFSQLLKLYTFTTSADKISELKQKADSLKDVDEKMKESISSLFSK